MTKKKSQDDAPPGGWIGPSGDSGPPIAYATDTRMVHGKRVWNWKPVTPKQLAAREAGIKAALAGSPAPEPKPAPQIRVRTRKA